MTTTPATDEHLERLRGRVSGEGQAIATSSEIRQVLARIDADRARIAELEAENAEMLTIIEEAREESISSAPLWMRMENVIEKAKAEK